MPFFEVSCKNNINIEDAFICLARSIREQREHKVCRFNCLFCLYFNLSWNLFKGENFDEDEGKNTNMKNGTSNGLGGPFTLGNQSENGRCAC